LGANLGFFGAFQIVSGENLCKLLKNKTLKSFLIF